MLSRLPLLQLQRSSASMRLPCGTLRAARRPTVPAAPTKTKPLLQHGSRSFATVSSATAQAAEADLPAQERAPPQGVPADIEDLALYVHWPFCSALCTYCDFNKTLDTGSVDHSLWRRALRLGIARSLQAARRPARIQSIFLGGGTPSLAHPQTVAAVVDAAVGRSAAASIEITMEANPTSVETKRFRAFAEAGVNRLSVGVQALNDRDLAKLGRQHTAADGLRAFDLARAVFGADRASLDLMFGRPEQTLRDWEEELEQVAALQPAHVSLYELTLKPGTPAHRTFTLPADDEVADMYEAASTVLGRAGLRRYEVSNFARSGSECRHNLHIWHGGDYIGLGPGAHGRYRARSGDTLRTIQTPATTGWLKEIAAGGTGNRRCRVVEPPALLREILLLGLRLEGGVTPGMWARLSPEGTPDLHTTFAAHPVLQRLQDLGLVELDAAGLRATRAGLFVLDSVTADLMEAL